MSGRLTALYRSSSKENYQMESLESQESPEFLRFKAKLDTRRRLHSNSSEYWYAREIQTDLGYDKWENFEEVIERAMGACRGAGYRVLSHFLEIKNLGKSGKRHQRDYVLSRYACYLVAMNGDSSKREIAMAQTYFAYKTREQELSEDHRAMIERIAKREIVGVHLKQLNDVAKESGVEHFGVFHDRGNTVFYTMPTRELKARKGIPEKDAVLDYAGIAELSAVDFKNTLTTAVLAKESFRNEFQAIRVHEKVAANVRKAMKESGDIMPEDLPVEPHIKTVERQVKATNELPPKKEITPRA
jgi:DNA-damage-inducible protein D